jgi:hypothetical protein|tara:strand:+ start:158 stop:448 length:291 start_codon:yes stop_codon:yes gene_type:complete
MNDKYIKLVLTVIAVCLVVMTLEMVVPSANADGYNSQNYGLVPLNEDGTISVQLAPNSTIDVNIESINTRDKLNVNIKSSDSYSLQYAGPLNVEVD